MGITHTPRVIATVAKGLLRKVKDTSLGLTQPHKYSGRAGLLDVDYLGHMNNAAYFFHAEYARWAMSTDNNWLQAMVKNKYHFIVVSQSCRYRAEIRPVFRKFEIQSQLIGIDEKNLWLSQNFRHAQEGDDRLRAQIMVKAVMVRGREVMDPSLFLKECVGAEPADVDRILRSGADASAEEIITAFDALEESKRQASVLDDAKVAR